jgi:hypothetical protein
MVPLFHPDAEKKSPGTAPRNTCGAVSRPIGIPIRQKGAGGLIAFRISECRQKNKALSCKSGPSGVEYPTYRFFLQGGFST